MTQHNIVVYIIDMMDKRKQRMTCYMTDRRK